MISGVNNTLFRPIIQIEGRSTFDGFTVFRNAADTTGISVRPASDVRLSNLIIDRVSSDLFGGGIRIESASVTLANSIIKGCFSKSGFYSGGLTGRESEIRIDSSIFSNNVSTDVSTGGRGGGAAFYLCSVTIKDSSFSENVASEGACCGIGSSLNCHPGFGGAMYLSGSNVKLASTRIYGNHHTIFGSGIYGRDSAIDCSNCDVLYNRGTAPGVLTKCPLRRGAGMSVENCESVFKNCKFMHNAANLTGGIEIAGGISEFHSCLIADNSSESLATIVISSTCAEVIFKSCTVANNINENDGVTFSIEEGASVSFRNSIVRNASSETPLIDGADSVLASYSNIQGGFSGEGNIDEDPLFVGSEEGDYRLQVGSPCIDAASTFGPSQDLDGAPRPVDILGIGRDGPGAFDMGAYEFQLKKSDLDKNGRTDAKDLLLFQEDWYETQQN